MNLSMSGFDEEWIHECVDGKEAIEKLDALQISDVDTRIIVVLELHMTGGMDGNVAALHIRDSISDYSTRKPFLDGVISNMTEAYQHSLKY